MIKNLDSYLVPLGHVDGRIPARVGQRHAHGLRVVHVCLREVGLGLGVWHHEVVDQGHRLRPRPVAVLAEECRQHGRGGDLGVRLAGVGHEDGPGEPAEVPGRVAVDPVVLRPDLDRSENSLQKKEDPT